MAMSNAERQRKWIQKNRALHNLRRRNKRKDFSSAKAGESKRKDDSGTGKNDVGLFSGTKTGGLQQSQAPNLPAKLSKIDELRALMKTASEAPASPVVVPPTIYRNDYGQVIPEWQWKQLQARKQRAKNGGYEIDDFSQA